MLQSMRQLAQTWVVKGLMMFLVLSFGIWGIGDMFRGNPLERTVASVGSIDIDVQALDHEFEQSLAEARQSLPDLTDQQARQLGLMDKALNAMVERALIDQDLTRLGVTVGDRTVLDEMAALPQLRDKDGGFNKDLFRAMLYKSGLSEKEFFATERQRLARQQLVGALTGNAQVPQTMVDWLDRARGQQRIFDVVTLKNASVGAVAPPSDKDLQTFYQQNIGTYTAPEYRAITMVRLATADLAKSITVTDADVKRAFAKRQAVQEETGQRSIVQVVVPDEAKAKALATAARKSGNLPEAARKMGLTAVPFDMAGAKAAIPGVAKAVAALKENEVSAPLHSNFGWHVAQARALDFDSMKERLREELKRDKAIDQATTIVNKLDDQLAAGHDLDDIAEGMGLRLIKIPAVDAKGKVPGGGAPPELPDAAQVLKAAFGQDAGQTSPILDDHNGNYTVVQTDKVIPSAPIPFDQIKARVATDWQAAQQTTRAKAEAGKIADALQAGKPVLAFAGQSGIAIRLSQPISMLGDDDPGIPQVLAPQLLKMKKGAAVVVPMDGRQMILHLAKLVDVDPATDAAGKSKISEDLANKIPNDRIAEYLEYLRILFPVSIDRSRLANLRQQGG
ncbi:MAG TPA: SurA N-terminal domain-containing protein [Alphaproteobacteria bacterium]|nr:SurA N-terminal domain-containing protein [Alphaproteobacteria bacterium]